MVTGTILKRSGNPPKAVISKSYKKEVKKYLSVIKERKRLIKISEKWDISHDLKNNIKNILYNHPDPEKSMLKYESFYDFIRWEIKETFGKDNNLFVEIRDYKDKLGTKNKLKEIPKI